MENFETITTIILKVKGGVFILDTYKEAIEIATDFNAKVEFDFNSIICYANPGDDPQSGSDAYFHAIKNKIKTITSKKLNTNK